MISFLDCYQQRIEIDGMCSSPATRQIVTRPLVASCFPGGNYPFTHEEIVHKANAKRRHSFRPQFSISSFALSSDRASGRQMPRVPPRNEIKLNSCTSTRGRCTRLIIHMNTSLVELNVPVRAIHFSKRWGFASQQL